MIIFGLVIVFLLVIILLLLIGWLTITCLPDILKDYDEAIGKLKERQERRNKIKK